MPTIILLDVSLSMLQKCVIEADGLEYQHIHLANVGIKHFLDHMGVNCKLEFVSLVVYSSLYQVLCPFTRDFDAISKALLTLELYDKTCIETGLLGIKKLFTEEWGVGVPCQVVLITDGSLGVGSGKLKQQIGMTNKKLMGVSQVVQPSEAFPLPFPFPCKLHVMVVGNPSVPEVKRNTKIFQRLVDLSGGEGGVYLPENTLTVKSVEDMFKKMEDSHFTSFQGILRCGNLSANIILSPSPQPYNKMQGLDLVRRVVSSEIQMLGFLHMNDMASPPVLSRHLVTPKLGEDAEMAENTGDEDEPADEGTIRSFCVLLHGALKVENMVALVLLGEDWFGMLYSWADNKKKFNLMLSAFYPGRDAAPWLGDLGNLYPASELPDNPYSHNTSPFPIRVTEKRSYAESRVVWNRQAGLQSDIQKILRHARKLPDKTKNFYNELNRVRRAALSLGFYELLESLASILERECTLLPAQAHPDCAIQLSHAAAMLRQPQSRDIRHTTTPSKTNFGDS